VDIEPGGKRNADQARSINLVLDFTTLRCPALKSVVIVLLIMNIGYLLESGFEPQYLLGNGMNVDYSENIDIFVLRYGIAQSNFSLSIAAGMFKTVVSFILLFSANTIPKRMGESRLF
jgi:putative aldouronate transport system permease protein